MTDNDVKILAWRLTLIPCGLAGMATFQQGWTAVALVAFVGTIAYGFFAAVLQVASIRNGLTYTPPAPPEEPQSPTVTVTRQPSPPPTNAPLRAESVVRYMSPEQRIAETDAEAGRVRADPNQYKLMVAIREGKIPRNAISERRIADALGMNRFGDDVKTLIRNLAAKGRLEKRGQFWAWVD
jgi:uncharacterized protein (DUF58 family)